MTIGKISEAQAKEFAYAFISYIPSYIERNKERYIEYLQATGQKDEYYQAKETEAE